MSDSIHHQLFIVPEATYGTTPATPALSTVRHTSCSLALSKDTFKSNEIDASRNLKDYRHGNQQIGGDVGVEISSGTYDTLLEALLMGTWATNVLKIGTTRRSFSMLRKWTDQGTAGKKQHHLFTGCEVNKLALKLVAGKIIEGTFGFLGRDVSYADAAPTGATYPAATTTLPMDAFSGSASVGGASYNITELTLNLENGLTPNFVLFSSLTSLPSNQVCGVSGEIGLRFESAALLEAFKAATQMAFTFTIQDSNAKSYTFSMPKVMLNGGQPDAGGEGPVNLKIPFTAIYDGTDASTIKITRVP